MAIDGQAIVDKTDHGLDEVVVEIIKMLRNPVLKHITDPGKQTIDV